MEERMDGERRLLARCARGELAAYEPIVRAHRSRAYQYARAIVHNHHDALELSQDAFARAFRALNTFDLARPFLPWFLRILRNVCLNAIAKDARRPRSVGGETSEIVLSVTASPGDNPRTASLRRERAEQVRAAVELLSPDHREIIVLRHFDDLSYAEIAEILTIPMGTVMSRLFNARKRLAGILKSSTRSE